MSKISRGKGFVICAVFSMGVWVLCNHVNYSITDSVGYNFFIKKTLDRNDVVKKGDYVSFDTVVPDGKKVRELKKVSCVPGDTLKITEGAMASYFCNEEYLGESKSATSSGEKLPQFRYNGIVPQNSLFVFGKNAHSFDSRYYGFVTRDRLKEKFWPII